MCDYSDVKGFGEAMLKNGMMGRRINIYKSTGGKD
jgi:hypothetical protein